MESTEHKTTKSRVRNRANAIKPFQCKHLIAVIEDPENIGNIGTIIRNANALGVEKVYIIDPRNTLPDEWQDMRQNRPLSKTSVSAVKWTFVKRFDNTSDCLKHLKSLGFESIVTSPHVKGRTNVYLDEADYSVSPKLAVWFGNERHGITELAVEHSKMCVAIPMFGMIESLNLATSSGIVLYEVTKQRRAYQSEYSRSNQREKRDEPLTTVLPRKK